MRVLNKRTDEITPGAIYVGRPTKWGNPFVVGKHGSRHQVVMKYRAYIRSNKRLMAQLQELAGHDLVCWCAPAECHAHVLVELVEGLES